MHGGGGKKEVPIEPLGSASRIVDHSTLRIPCQIIEVFSNISLALDSTGQLQNASGNTTHGWDRYLENGDGGEP